MTLAALRMYLQPSLSSGHPLKANWVLQYVEVLNVLSKQAKDDFSSCIQIKVDPVGPRALMYETIHVLPSLLLGIPNLAFSSGRLKPEEEPSGEAKSKYWSMSFEKKETSLRRASITMAGELPHTMARREVEEGNISAFRIRIKFESAEINRNHLLGIQRRRDRCERM